MNSTPSNTWNLKLLFENDNDPKMTALRKEVLKVSGLFVKKWKGNNKYLSSSKELKKALDEYNLWLSKYGALHAESYYFHLRYSLDQVSPQIKAKMAKTEDLSKKIENEMQFFELNLAKIKVENQRKFLKDKNLNLYKHFLEKIFAQAPHLLSDSEEKIMNLKSTSSYENWVRMTSGFISKETANVIGENGKKTIVSFPELFGLMNSQKKKVRDKAAKAFNKILSENVEVAEIEMNAILQDKKVNDRIRNYKNPEDARLMSDDIDSIVVNNLKKVVEKNYEISKSYYKLKAKLLGVPKLAYHEVDVEYGKIDKNYSFQKGSNLVFSTFDELDSEFGTLARKFVSEGRVDVFPKKGKSSGAFCIYGLITHPTYILLNWNNKLNDVLTFAHELGHGINDELVKKSQNAINFGTPISTAEVASTFMEDFVLEQILREADDELKLSLMMMKLNEDVRTIFRQIACYNLEKDLHKEFRNVGYLSKEKIGEIFNKNMSAYMGSGVEKSEGCENWWVYWSHLRYYFYVYSYSSGLLISKSLQTEVKKDPRFIEKVKVFLSTGMSESPKEIFSKLGIDITNKNFWEKGVKEVEILLNETENLANKLNKI